jgi:hypothetical protein
MFASSVAGDLLDRLGGIENIHRCSIAGAVFVQTKMGIEHDFFAKVGISPTQICYLT